jgi:tetratricopeptide (TPR) repeat protein
LRLAAEHELALPPLAAEPAKALFQRRARAVDPRSTHAGEDIDRICERLDGLPLAIELAAARTKVLTPHEILERLTHRLDLLSTGPRDAPRRQQTLRAAIGWSYDLLDPDAQRLFSQLGVFNGGFTLSAAEAVCGPAALDGIAALADHSLLSRADGRFQMLETVREYALEQLADDRPIRDRHARAFADAFTGAEQGMESPAMPDWLRRLDADRENLHAALRHATLSGDADAALRLVNALWRYWSMRGGLAEARALAAAALALDGATDEVRLPAINGAGVIAAEHGDFPAARVHFETALQLARELGLRDRIARIGSNLGSLEMYAGDYETAIARYQEATAFAREIGNARSVSLMLQNLGIAHDVAGHADAAIRYLDESVTLAHDAADPAHLTSAQILLARLLFEREPERADALLRESLQRAHELSDANALPACLETAAHVLGGVIGAQLWGAAGALRAAAGAARQPDELHWSDAAEAALRHEIGDAAFAQAAREGAQLTPDEAVERALRT